MLARDGLGLSATCACSLSVPNIKEAWDADRPANGVAFQDFTGTSWRSDFGGFGIARFFVARASLSPDLGRKQTNCQEFLREGCSHLHDYDLTHAG